MRLQNLCQIVAIGALTLSVAAADETSEKRPVHDFPTTARVEYVTACMDRAGNKLAALYQCSCAIDRIADQLSYDDYVEASTFAKYATLPGEGGGIFRDPKRGRDLGKQYLQLEASSLKACGVH
jgi:hypothetical protein